MAKERTVHTKEHEDYARALSATRHHHQPSWVEAEHPGCQLSGFLLVDRAPGNFHIQAQSRGHDLAAHMTNVSHIINHLSFGKPFSNYFIKNLNIFTATAESGLQIVEQILPFFQPDYTVTVIAVPELDIKRDVPIILNNVNYEDSYSGDYTTRRAVIYTLNFTAKTYLFGPATTQKTIKEVQSDLYTDTPVSTREERITITPNPTSADANDDFGFTTTITTFNDAKNYNPSTDTDE